MVSENKYLRGNLEKSVGKDASDKIIEILVASGAGLTESGGTALTMGAVSDSQFLRRSGTTIIGAAAGGLAATAVKTADYQAIAGDLVLVDASGGNVTVTSPASPAAGDQFGVYASAAPGANAVTITATVDNAQHDKKLYIAGDLLIFQYDSTLLAWVTTSERLKPHCCLVTLSAAVTTNTAATLKVIAFDTETYDIGGLYATTKATIRRAGKYRITIQGKSEATVSVAKYWRIGIRQDGTTALAQGRWVNCDPVTARLDFIAGTSITVQLAAAAYVEGTFTAEETDDGCADEAVDTFMLVEEIR